MSCPTSDAFEATRRRFRRSLLILHNDDFDHFAQYATEVVARVGLDYDTKTVKSGALFYEEFLPPETLFYSIVLANEARAKTGGDGARPSGHGRGGCLRGPERDAPGGPPGRCRPDDRQGVLRHTARP